MKNRHGKPYCFSGPYGENMYVFNMREEDMKYSRFGGKDGEKGIDHNDLGFFDPPGGPFIHVGYQIHWEEIDGATEPVTLTVKKIMDFGAEGIFVEVE